MAVPVRMHPAQIKAALEMAGYTQARIARLLGRKNSMVVSHVIHGRSRSRLIELRIAAVLGKSPHQIWPDWYTPDDEPVYARRQPVRLTDAARAIREFQPTAVVPGKAA